MQDTQECVVRPKKPWVHPNESEYSTCILLWQEQQSSDFHTFIDPWSFIWRSPNLLCKCLPIKGGYTPIWSKSHKPFPRYEWLKFQVFSLLRRSFCTNYKICSNSQAYNLIQLKFCTILGHPEAIISTNFGENLWKILRVIIDHVRKTRAIFRHAYRVNCWLDQPENR